MHTYRRRYVCVYRQQARGGQRRQVRHFIPAHERAQGLEGRHKLHFVTGLHLSNVGSLVGVYRLLLLLGNLALGPSRNIIYVARVHYSVLTGVRMGIAGNVSTRLIPFAVTPR